MINKMTITVVVLVLLSFDHYCFGAATLRPGEVNSSSYKGYYQPQDNLVINGGFARRYEGWNRQTGNITQGASKTEIISYQNGGSDKALHIMHEGNGFLQFSQVVAVPSADLYFNASFQASSHEGRIIGFSGTGIAQIALQYFNEEGILLAQTTHLNYVKNHFADTPLIGVPRRNSDTYKTHYIEFENDKLYSNYGLDIRKEIEDNLLGVDATAVRKVALVIWCGANHSQAGSELSITDIRLKLK